MKHRPANKRAELAKIHIAKKQLGMDDDTYRGMLWTLCRVRSAKDLDAAGRDQVLKHLKRRGFRAQAKGTPANINSAAHGPMLRKIHALLTARKRPWAYADGIAKQMFGIERLQFCGADQLHKIISALSIDAQREHKATEG